MTPTKITALTHEVKETGEVVVYDQRGSQLLLLNDMGAAVWLLLDGQRSIDDIARLIAESLPEASAPPDRIVEDVRGFVETLRGHGLVELGSG